VIGVLNPLIEDNLIFVVEHLFVVAILFEDFFALFVELVIGGGEGLKVLVCLDLGSEAESNGPGVGGVFFGGD
jgi:hypothetical protein